MWKTSGILIFFFAFHTVITSPISKEFGFQETDCSKSTQGSFIKCTLPINRWKWSVDNGTCVKFIYDGCNPLGNNFRTHDDCIKVAKPICSKLEQVSSTEYTVTTSTGSPAITSTESTAITYTGSPAITSTGSPAITSTGSPAITSTDIPAITSTGSPAITSTGIPAITSTGSPAITSTESTVDYSSSTE